MPPKARRVREALVRELHSAETLDEVIEATDRVVRPAIAASGGAWSTVDPASLLGTTCTILADFGDGPVQLPHDPRRERAFFAVEWEDTEPDTFHDLLRSGRVASVLSDDVDDLRLVPRVPHILEPMGVTDEARALLSVDGDVWGTVTFYRMFEPEPFDPRAIEVLEACSPVAARAIRTALLRRACNRVDISDPPGSLLLGADDHVLVSSETAESLLGRLDEHHARAALESLAAAARNRGAMSTRVTGVHGTIVLHASPAKGLDGAISIVIEHPRPVELAPLIVLSLGLSARERMVTELVLQGHSRAQMARRLDCSNHTVDDHLKNIYRKAEVASRSELCALLFGSFYEGRRDDGADPSPYGFFLEPDEVATARSPS